MDTKTPPIPLRHHERKEFHHRKQERTTEPVSLPPLTPIPSNCHQQQHRSKIPGNSASWNKGPNISRTSDHHRRRPYRVLHIGATPLMHACQQADRSRVLRLLKEQEDTVGFRDRTLRSALHYCMDAGTGGAVASAAPELVNAPDAEGHTPLHLAVIAGDTQLVAVLLANGADVNAKDSEGHSVLHWATVCGEAECVRLVLAAGARPSTPDHRGGSPLHYAAQCCGAAVTAELSVPKKIGLKVLQTLLEFGADVNAKDEDGRQPILWAASAGSVEAVLALARAGGSAAAGATDKDGLTALHCAASRGHARCVETLVNLCGCHPDHVDDNGCSALHYAATLGHADATALLLRLGADPNRQDRKGRTPALCAAAKGQLETLKILAQHGGSLHARTIRGTGVAHEAVLSGRIELIEWLAKKRPSTLDVATHDGKTPLHVAALHGYLDVCKVLLDNGARINAVLRTSKSGPMTALDAALYRGHRDCAKLVQMHGGTTAQQLRTHRTAPNRVFAAKLRVKPGDSSDEGDTSSSEKGRRHGDSDVYIEERWIEKRTRRRGAGSSPRKFEDRRGSRSFSEEEVRLGKTSKRRERCRRARSESARYEGCRSAERCERKNVGKRLGRHDYDESSSESSDDDVEEAQDDGNKRFRSKNCGKTERTSKASDCKKDESSPNAKETDLSEEDDKSLSDDSLEVVVVKKSLEKTSEKVQICGRKSKTPRESSRETRVTKTRRRSSRKKSKPGRSGSRAERIEERQEDRAKALKTSRKSGGNDESTEKSEERTDNAKEKERVEEIREERVNQFGKDATDSTSQETVERVIVTALVHKDQAPDTPKVPAKLRKGSVSSSPSKPADKDVAESKDRVESRGGVVTSEMDEMLKKADQLQNALLTKAADLKKDVDDIRRQMTDGSSPDNGRTERATSSRKGSRATGEETSEGSDELVTVKVRRNDDIVNESTSEDCQRESSRMKNQGELGTSPESSGREEVVEGSIEKVEEGENSDQKSSKSSQGQTDDGRTAKKEKPSTPGDDKSPEEAMDEVTLSSANLSRRPSTAKQKMSPTTVESNCLAIEEKKSDEKSAEPIRKTDVEEDKSDGSMNRGSRRESREDNSWGSKSSGSKSFKTLPDEDEDNEATSTEEASRSTKEKYLKAETKEDIAKIGEIASSSEELRKSDGKSDEKSAETVGNEEKILESSKSEKLRPDGSSLGSAKSTRVQGRSRPSTGKSGRRESTGSASKSPPKSNVFESSGELSPDRSAIVAVIESPEWDDADDREIDKEIRDAIGEDGEEAETEPDIDDGLGVVRVLPSTSEEETTGMSNKLLRGSKTESFTRVDRRFRVKTEGATSPQGNRDERSGRAKQRRDSGGRDSGIEPSPRVSKIPKRTFKCYPNTDKQQALNMETVTRDVQISLRRYHLERKIFFQLMELKRLQIRHGRTNEHVLVKRQVESFHKAGMTGPTLGVVKYDLPLTFRHFEAFLYEQLRRLQRRPATPNFCTEAKQCTEKTHRCHHATSAYTSIPIYTYRDTCEDDCAPLIEDKITTYSCSVEVTRGEEKQVIALPTEKLDRTKRYFVTFTVRGENQENETTSEIKTPLNNAQRNAKSG